jgi:hypothetical protein
MHIDWQRLFEYVYANRLPITGGATLIVTSGVRTMPVQIPRSWEDCWTWMRDWTHQFWNLPNKMPAEPLGK